MALANGGTLCIFPQEVLASGQELVNSIREGGITNMTLPPSVLRVLPPDEFPALETVIAAGEACTPDLIERWADGRQFINAYGPTETTVCASMYLCHPDEKDPPPIGKPILNTKLYILDKNFNPVPVGVPGELCVSGVSLARGYLHRPDISSEKFVTNPFITGERLYRTGDLVSYRLDGNIDFLGRVDLQVKVRGFRIELGEVENVLGGHPSIREAVVVTKDDNLGEKRLVGYLVPNTEQAPSMNELRSFMRQVLPEYMVPSTFVYMDEFPMSPSGKIDRNALPDPEDFRSGLETEYVAPRNEQEETLTKICSELLGLQQVGIYDNFFELGGHSLLATQFISRVRDEFEVDIPLRSLFENPTVANLAEKIIEANNAKETNL